MRPSWTSCLAILASLSFVKAASIQRLNVTLNNPTNVGFYIYVPNKLATKPPILVNPHWCHGSANAAYTGSQFASLADKYGFIVIYPDSPHTADKCWDLSSNQTLTHNAGGDSLGIVSMVKWALSKYDGDASRVFVTGVSSGAMMTSTLIGAYPDIFAAGSAWSGVPFGCYAAPGNNTSVYGYWNSDCANGRITKSGQDWAAMIKAAYPTYNGWRPKMQIFHGTTDETLNYTVFGEEVKEWNSVFGYSDTPTTTASNTPLPNWTTYSYGPEDWFQATSARGVPHNIQVQDNVIVDFFQLTCTSDNCFSWGKGGPVHA